MPVQLSDLVMRAFKAEYKKHEKTDENEEVNKILEESTETLEETPEEAEEVVEESSVDKIKNGSRR